MTDIDYFPGRQREKSVPMPELISRKDHLCQFRKDYNDGQHVTLIGPTQRGKSRLGKELLKQVISPARKALILVGKPPGRERTWDDDAAKELNLHITETWPVQQHVKATHFFRGRGLSKDNNGWILRPRQLMEDVEEDERNLREQFSSGIMSNYRKASAKAKRITVVDEGHQVQVDLGLKKQCEAPLMRGAPDNAMWTFVQRGRFVSYLSYDAPEHVYIFRDDDRSNQQRYSEIGGVDSQYLSHVVRKLEMMRVPSGGTISQSLYFRRAGNTLHIVDT